MKKLFFSFFIMLLLTLLGILFVLNPIFEKLFEGYLDSYYIELARGPLSMIMEDLEKLPQDEQSDYIEALQPSFGFALSIYDYKDIKLSKDELEKVFAGKIIVKEDGEFFYKRIKDTKTVLVMGPFPEINVIFIDILGYICLGVFMAFYSFIWAITYWRDFKKISKATLEFGRGRFETRAQVSRWSALAPLAFSFNKMADRIQQLIKSHKDLTNAVSHELRTPITRIRFGMAMVESAKELPDKTDYLSGIRHDVDELDSLVTEMLTYARFDRESPGLELEKHKIVSWFRDIEKYSQVERNKIKISFETIVSELTLIVFEPLFMGRALGNLILNAVRHTKRRVLVIMEVKRNMCFIHVDDDGAGVPPDDRKRIFEPFVRLDSSRNRKSGGYGLGLSIVSRIAESHGGSVDVTDSPLGGARFTIAWPDCN